MLVVVEDRDIQRLLQPFLDLKAAWRADVLQIDAAEARSQPGDSLDDLFRILGIQADGNRVHAAEFLEQDGLSFHDRHGGVRADVAEAQNGGTVGNHGDGIRLHGVGISGFLILRDDLAGLRDAGRIGQGQILSGFYGNLGNGFQLSVQLFMKRQRFFICRHRNGSSMSFFQ